MSRSASPAPVRGVQLGLRANLAQFALLVVVNAFVGAMVGIERSILPAIAEQEFQLAARTAILSGFHIERITTGYMKGPRPMTFMFEGRATPS